MELHALEENGKNLVSELAVVVRRYETYEHIACTHIQHIQRYQAQRNKVRKITKNK